MIGRIDPVVLTLHSYFLSLPLRRVSYRAASFSHTVAQLSGSPRHRIGPAFLSVISHTFPSD